MYILPENKPWRQKTHKNDNFGLRHIIYYWYKVIDNALVLFACWIFSVNTHWDKRETVILTWRYLFMPPTSKKLRGHIGLGLCMCPCVGASVRPLRFAYGQERLEIGSWNLICVISMKNKRTCISFLFVGLFVAELCPFFDSFFFYFAIISLWNLVSKISGEPLQLGSWYLAHRLCPRCRWPD